MGKRFQGLSGMGPLVVATDLAEHHSSSAREARTIPATQKLDYIASMANDLQSMAEDCGCATLAGLFELARREADLRRRI